MISAIRLSPVAVVVVVFSDMAIEGVPLYVEKRCDNRLEETWFWSFSMRNQVGRGVMREMSLRDMKTYTGCHYGPF